MRTSLTWATDSAAGLAVRDPGWRLIMIGYYPDATKDPKGKFVTGMCVTIVVTYRQDVFFLTGPNWSHTSDSWNFQNG